MQEFTREILWNIPAWASVGIYFVLIFVLAILAKRTFYYYKLWTSGRNGIKINRIGERIKDLIIYTIGHKKTIRDAYPGTMHLLIFVGFTTPFIGTVIVWIEHRSPLHFFMVTSISSFIDNGHRWSAFDCRHSHGFVQEIYYQA